MLDLKLVRQNAELKSKDNFYTWIAPDRVIAMIDEIERLQDAKRRALAIADERAKENVALRAVLKPFAALIEAIECTTERQCADTEEWDLDAGEHSIVKLGDLRRARSALRDSK